MKSVLSLLLLLIQASQWVSASDDLLMVRSNMDFPEAMSVLQNSIIEHQYTLSRVQRVDIGLEKAGYQTDRYRIVFFGKQGELKPMTDKYPELAAYLPLKMVIFAERDDTLLIAYNPMHLQQIVDVPEYNLIYSRWLSDIKSIMSDLTQADSLNGSFVRK